MMTSKDSLANNLTQTFSHSFAGLGDAKVDGLTHRRDRLAFDGRRGYRTASRVEAPVQSNDPSHGWRNWARISPSIFRKLRSPYVVNAGIIVLLYAIASQPYFNLARFVSNAFLCLGAKTCLMAVVNIVANEFIPSIQAFLTSRLVRWVWAITLLPMLSMVRLVTTAKLRSALLPVRLRLARLAAARRRHRRRTQ